MSAHANPNIITDGLVFLYDTDDGKSYKGEPTTNLITNSGTSNTGWVGYGWTGSQAISNDYPNTYEFTATNGWHNRTFDTGITSGGTIYVSFQYKLKQQQTTQNQIFVLNGTHLGSYTNYIGNGSMSFEWQTFSGSFTANANSSKIAIGPRGQDSSGLTDIVYIRNLQVEQKPHATQFVNGTRSATQGLIDRTGTSTIDLSNVSFDSDAQMTFDGTDDYITAGNPTELQFIYSDPFSLEVWIKADDLSGFNHVIGKTYGNYRLSVTSSGYSFRLDSNNLTTNAGTPVVGEWQHVVATWEPSTSTARVYVNGVLEQSVTDATVDWTYTSANFQLGNSPGENYHFNGTIPAARVYSKTVTSAEVLQNFNATKPRFEL